ncbi:MAG: hypothetical protein WBA13_13695 [Microcoleaceae cyanobacterium]
MAFYIIILKEIESADRVTYRFGSHEDQLGLLNINKNDGKVEELEPAPTENHSALFYRAAAKIHQHWREGSYPQKSSWAS